MSLTITARSVITGALGALGVADGSAPPSAEDMQRGFDALKELVDSWSLQSLTALLQERTVYPLVAGTQDYAIGPGLLAPAWSTGTAARPIAISGAARIDLTAPDVEIAIGVAVDVPWPGAPTQTAGSPQIVYYKPSVPDGLIALWPVPTAAGWIALYTPLLVPNFQNLSADYVAAPGYAKALRYNLAKVLVADFAVPELVEARVTREADQSLRDLKIVNVRIGELGLDPALTGDGGWYAIESDQ